ncbi:MAG TPA: N-acyl homoserine lactonase family protein [Blastocatellia bacterium]|nr:N-acyl homoserine lactonase family protein [Blastocatellia bacterium]
MRLLSLSLCVLLLCGAGTFLSTQARQQATPPEQAVYEIYAISYAVIPDFPVASLVAGADKTRRLDIRMMIWLLKGPGGRNILVDAGFYRDKFFRQWKVRDFVKPSEAIARVGLRPEDITDIFITHMHWDHADGMDLFPKARIWIQQEEFSYYTGEAWQTRTTHGGIEAEDVLALVRLNTEGRVTLIRGDNQEVMPGIRCHTGGRHTWASQYLSVRTRAGTAIVASDNLYLDENLDKGAPIAQTLDAALNLQAQERMKQLASHPRLIVPGHDPAVFARFPKPGNGVARIEQGHYSESGAAGSGLQT